MNGANADADTTATYGFAICAEHDFRSRLLFTAEGAPTLQVGKGVGRVNVSATEERHSGKHALSADGHAWPCDKIRRVVLAAAAEGAGVPLRCHDL